MDITGARMRVTQAATALKEATEARDKAITAAYQDGATAIEIAAQVGLTRQQVHRIVAGGPTTTIAALRAEVIQGDTRYVDLIEDDQIHVDLEVGRLARERGITLTA